MYESQIFFEVNMTAQEISYIGVEKRSHYQIKNEKKLLLKRY